jgi:superfamily II DNA/RNA helicase
LSATKSSPGFTCLGAKVAPENETAEGSTHALQLLFVMPILYHIHIVSVQGSCHFELLIIDLGRELARQMYRDAVCRHAHVAVSEQPD